MDAPDENFQGVRPNIMIVKMKFDEIQVTFYGYENLVMGDGLAAYVVKTGIAHQG